MICLESYKFYDAISKASDFRRLHAINMESRFQITSTAASSTNLDKIQLVKSENRCEESFSSYSRTTGQQQILSEDLMVRPKVKTTQSLPLKKATKFVKESRFSVLPNLSCSDKICATTLFCRFESNEDAVSEGRNRRRLTC